MAPETRDPTREKGSSPQEMLKRGHKMICTLDRRAEGSRRKGSVKKNETDGQPLLQY